MSRAVLSSHALRAAIEFGDRHHTVAARRSQVIRAL
jgi:hypothetical protein